MKKYTPLWILIGLLILVIILIAPRAFNQGRGVAMHQRYGMMDHDDAFHGMMDHDDAFYGMMGHGQADFRTRGHGLVGFALLIPILLFILLIAAGVWLGNVLSSRKFHSSKGQSLCPHCSKPADDEWTTCPYCSKSLKK